MQKLQGVTQGKKTADVCNQSQLKCLTSYCSQNTRATWEDVREKSLQRGNRGTTESAEPTIQTLKTEVSLFPAGIFLHYSFYCYTSGAAC